MKFNSDIEEKVIKAGFELMNEDENIWIKENGEKSVTISGEGNRIECMWQDFDGNFSENLSNDINEIIFWSKAKLELDKHSFMNYI